MAKLHGRWSKSRRGIAARTTIRGAVVLALAIVLLSAACEAAAPLANVKGASAGLAATPKDKHAAARALIAKTRTAPVSSRTDYVRSKFGSGWIDGVSSSIPFARNGCDTRNDILRRDLTSITVKPNTRNCVILSGKLADPYTGRSINFVRGNKTSIAVQIDHVISLAYAWKMGAANWTEAKRKDFYNDPINLMATDGPTNGSKGDKGPVSWLPPNSKVRCSYAIRWAQVAQKYQLPVSTADKNQMTLQCR